MKQVSAGVTWTVVLIPTLVLASLLFIALNAHRSELIQPINASLPNEPLLVTSTAFKNNSPIPDKYTCTADNSIPPIEIANVDPQVKSLVLIMEDPDGPQGIFDHWIKFNMPPDTLFIDEGQEPPGVGGKGSNGTLTYTGPCPVVGTDRYYFKVYSLDTMLDLPEGSSRTDVEHAIQNHVLQVGQLIGTYSKK